MSPGPKLPLELKNDKALFNEDVLLLLLFIGLIFHRKTVIEKLLQRISISLSE